MTSYNIIEHFIVEEDKYEIWVRCLRFQGLRDSGGPVAEEQSCSN